MRALVALALLFAAASSAWAQPPGQINSPPIAVSGSGAVTVPGGYAAEVSVSSGIPGCPISSQPTNLLTAPNNFSNAAWTQQTVLSITANATADPCGNGTDAQAIADSASDTSFGVYQGTTIATAGGTATVACFFRQNAGRYVVLSHGQDGSNYVYAVLDTQTGTVTQSGALGVGVLGSAPTAQSAGGGWYYLRVTGVGTATTTDYAVLQLSNTGTPGVSVPSYTGTGVGVFAYQCRLSNGAN